MTTQTADTTPTTAAPVTAATPAPTTTPAPVEGGAATTTAAEGTTTVAATAPSAEDLAAKAAADADKAEKSGRLAEVKRLAAQTRARYLETDAAKRARQDADQARAAADRSRGEVYAELEALKAYKAEAEKDPWAFARSKGMTAQQVAERELSENTDDAKLKELSDRISAADKRAEDAEKKAQAIIDANQARADQAARIEAWETAKSAALTSFESGKDKLADLHAWVEKQAAKSGASKTDILVDEMLAAVNRIKANPKTAPFAAEYTDDEILEAINQRFEGYARVNAPPPAATAAPTSIASATQVTAPLTTQATDSKTGAPKPDTGTVQKPAPTLTNADASQATGTYVQPEDWDKWSDRKQNEWLAKHLKAGTLPMPRLPAQ